MKITAWVHIAKTIGVEIIPERTEKCHAVKIVKTKGIINNRYGNESIYVQSPCFMCKWNPTDNRVIMYEPINRQTKIESHIHTAIVRKSHQKGEKI